MNANIKRTELDFYIILYDYLYMHLTMTTYVHVLTLNLWSTWLKQGANVWQTLICLKVFVWLHDKVFPSNQDAHWDLQLSVCTEFQAVSHLSEERLDKISTPSMSSYQITIFYYMMILFSITALIFSMYVDDLNS